MYNPLHPGRLLRVYLGEMPVGEAAKRLHVARSTLSRVLNGRASISADMALRFSEAFGNQPYMCLGMQQQYDLWHASRRRRPKVAAFPRAA
jgi:addiction module HigA family antidote